MITRVSFVSLAVAVTLAASCGQRIVDSPISPSDAAAPQRIDTLAATGVAHTVTGSGVITPYPGFAFTMTVAAQLDAQGNVTGTATGRSLDLSAFGIFEDATFVWDVRCMRVVGQTAWFGVRVSHSTNPALGSPGDLGAAWVVDRGGPGEDIVYSGPSWFLDPGDAICSANPPAMPNTVARPGNFTVR